MTFFDILYTAFMNLWRRKLRAMLTVLGMVIGTASIVVMVSLGIGNRQAMIESYSQMGSLTNITVMRWKSVETENGEWSSTETKLDKRSVEAFKKIDGVEAVMPRITTWGMLKSGKYVADINIMAVETAQAEEFGIELAEGQMPSGRSAGGTYEMVLGNEVLRSFYDPKTGKPAQDRDGNPKVDADSRFSLTFDYVNIYGGEHGEGEPSGKIYRAKPTGVLTDTNYQFSWYCIMDIEAVKKLARENAAFMNIETNNYSEVIVKCRDTDSVRDVKNTIADMGYGTDSLQDWIDQAEKSMEQTQYLLGAIGGVSLLVAAIGIMNTMMMSIYERTKEIGIIKVLGCRMKNIAELFLAEAAYIGLFGGAIGIGLSYGIGALLNTLLAQSGMRSLIPAWLGFGAVAFSMLVALISGLYPALRAMKLSPLTAIRSE